MYVGVWLTSAVCWRRPGERNKIIKGESNQKKLGDSPSWTGDTNAHKLYSFNITKNIIKDKFCVFAQVHDLVWAL